MAGLSEPTAGSVKLDGAAIDGPRSEMMFVFQQYTKSIFPWKTVIKNILLGVKYQSAASRESLKKLCFEHLNLVGLGRYPHYYPYQLSGGMQQAQERRAIILEGIESKDCHRSMAKALQHGQAAFSTHQK